MGHWDALSKALGGDDTVRFTWAELERLVGGLPPSAAKHRAWWSGDRPHVRVWRAAGYTVADLEPGRAVTFVRTGRLHAAEHPPRSQQPASHGTGLRPADVVLVACARTKLKTMAPARDLYISPLFQKSRAYAEQLGVPWFVLSAEHALLTPDQWVAPYDRYLPETSDSYRAAWGLWTVERLALLAGPLDGRVVEVHAGATYVDAVAVHLAAKGAQVIDRLKGMAFGARLAWYGAETPDASVPPAAPPEIDVTQLVERLSSVESAMRPAEFLRTDGAGLKAPGLYSWWVDHPGADDLGEGLKQPFSGGLIYAGLAGATRWPSGRRSTNTLWSRIATMHLGGSREFSTFRHTLGAILAAAAGRDRVDENDLTAWMHEHLRIVAVPFDDADTLGKVEALVLQAIDPPLNLQGMSGTPIRSRITELRRTYRRGG